VNPAIDRLCFPHDAATPLLSFLSDAPMPYDRI
jgi:hypothetical protein